MRNSLLALIAFFSLAATASARQDGKVTLRWKFKKGDTHRFELQQKSEMGGKVVSEMIFGYTNTVLEVDEKGTAKLKCSYSRIKMVMVGIDYDSDRDKEPPENPVAIVMAAFKGKKFEMIMDAQGKIEKVTGMEALLKEVGEGLNKNIRDRFLEAMKKSYTDEKMKEMMGGGFAVLPKEPVAIGQSWKSGHQMTNPAFGELTYRNKLTLKEVRKGGKEAVMSQETVVEGGKGGQLQLTEGKGSFEILWDVDRGIMRTMIGRLTMTINAGGQTMEMVTKSNTVMTSK